MKSLNTSLEQTNIPLNKNQVKYYNTCCSFKDWFSHLNARLKFLFIVYVFLVILSFYIIFLHIFRSILNIDWCSTKGISFELKEFFMRIIFPKMDDLYYRMKKI